jgi:bacillithiol biosynthesis cysteine-adding enzyme BshC
VPRSSAIHVDYLYHFDRTAPFYSGPPFQLSSFQRVAHQLTNTSRPKLVEILLRQNELLGASKASLENVRRLADPSTYVVATGQQVGLFSGPAFTLYKALTAVRLAQHLSDQGLPCVSVFWLATEDHDLEEVANTAVLDEEYNLVQLADSGQRPAPQSSVGFVKLSAAISTVLDRLDSLLATAPARMELMADLRASYRPGAPWGQAFGRLMARLFGRWGVVMLDALDEDIHRLAQPVYTRALQQAPSLRDKLRLRTAQLEAAGYHAQVNVTDDSTLLFVAHEGNRLALRQQGGKFLLKEDGQVTASSLEDRLRSRPLDFTPNALLRPIVQDQLLPTVAYVAGPAELAYHAQVNALYPEFGRPQPVIFPRASFTLMDGRVQRWMERYQLCVEDAWQGEEHLRRRIAASGFAPGWSERLDQTERELTNLLENLRADIETIDPTLLNVLNHTQEKFKYQFERLKGKISRAALRRSEELARHQLLLLRYLYPERKLQERAVSGIYFLARAGYGLLDHLLGNIQTHSSDHQVLGY